MRSEIDLKLPLEELKYKSEAGNTITVLNGTFPIYFLMKHLHQLPKNPHADPEQPSGAKVNFVALLDTLKKNPTATTLFKTQRTADLFTEAMAALKAWTPDDFKQRARSKDACSSLLTFLMQEHSFWLNGQDGTWKKIALNAGIRPTLIETFETNFSTASPRAPTPPPPSPPASAPPTPADPGVRPADPAYAEVLLPGPDTDPERALDIVANMLAGQIIVTSTAPAAASFVIPPAVSRDLTPDAATDRAQEENDPDLQAALAASLEQDNSSRWQAVNTPQRAAEPLTTASISTISPTHMSRAVSSSPQNRAPAPKQPTSKQRLSAFFPNRPNTIQLITITCVWGISSAMLQKGLSQEMNQTLSLAVSMGGMAVLCLTALAVWSHYRSLKKSSSCVSPSNNNLKSIKKFLSCTQTVPVRRPQPDDQRPEHRRGSGRLPAL